MTVRLIPEWREIWKFYSTWAVAMLTVWNALPTVLGDRLPIALQLGVSVLLFGSFALVRVVDQFCEEDDDGE